MTEILILLSCVAFFFIGRWSVKGESLTQVKENVNKKIREIRANDMPVEIEYPTREETDYAESQRKEIDKQQEENIRRVGIE